MSCGSAPATVGPRGRMSAPVNGRTGVGGNSCTPAALSAVPHVKTGAAQGLLRGLKMMRGGCVAQSQA